MVSSVNAAVTSLKASGAIPVNTVVDTPTAADVGTIESPKAVAAASLSVGDTGSAASSEDFPILVVALIGAGVVVVGVLVVVGFVMVSSSGSILNVKAEELALDQLAKQKQLEQQMNQQLEAAAARKQQDLEEELRLSAVVTCGRDGQGTGRSCGQWV